MKRNFLKNSILMLASFVLILFSLAVYSNAAETTQTGNVNFSKLKGTYYFYPNSYFYVSTGNVLKHKFLASNKEKLTGVKTITFYADKTYKLTTAKSTYNLYKVKINDKEGYINANLIKYKEATNANDDIIKTNNYKEGTLDASKLTAKHYFFPLSKAIVSGSNITSVKEKKLLSGQVKIKIYTDKTYNYKTAEGAAKKMYLAEIEGVDGFVNTSILAKVK